MDRAREHTITYPLLVEEHLRRLGLTSEILQSAARAGHLGRVSSTNHDPIQAPGWENWRWIVRRLRELMHEKGWTTRNPNGLPITVRPDNRVAIAVASGALGTGDADLTPTTSHPKGDATALYVRVNRRQLLLFPVTQNSPADASDFTKRSTWLFLTHLANDRIYAELSLPDSIDEFGFISEWRQRLILKPIDVEDSLSRRLSDTSPDDDEDRYDVPVVLRG